MEFLSGHIDSSIISLKRALHLNSHLFTPMLFLGKAFLQNGEPNLALSYLTKAHLLHPTDVETLRKLGKANHDLKQPGEASAFYAAAARSAPQDAAAWFGLGVSSLNRINSEGERLAATQAQSVWDLSILTTMLLIILSMLISGSLPARADIDPMSNHYVVIAPVPAEVASTHFTVSTDGGQSSPVMHAVANYYILNFEITGPVRITITSDDPHYWDAGVEIQPMRLGIRPDRKGASISFSLDAPAKLSITRPGDFSSGSEMLFLFGNKPDHSGITSKTVGVRYYGPGVYHENIDAKSGDHIYVAAGAVIYGSLNIWQVHDVSISGFGTIIYDGPQDPDHDEGWIHKPNWHVIVMDNASNIRVEGITGVVRSRTWMVQMRDSRGVVLRNVKIIGGSSGNANQDGMDWLGGGDTLVQDVFIRAADDIFAMQGNWDGYEDDLLRAPGHMVSNIIIADSVLSTSISNVVRLGWPKKTFDSHGFTLRNSDVIQMGVGACGAPFSVFEIWADPEGKGQHSDIHLEDIRLDHWYSLTQLRQPNPDIRNVFFKNIWAMDGPGMVPSVLKGDVAGVTFTGINLGSGQVEKSADLPIELQNGAAEPSYKPAVLDASFTYSSKHSQPHAKFKFKAKKQPGVKYRWFFGDGETGEGKTSRHSFPDAEGTLLDGSGRFRVLLSVSDEKGNVSWNERSVIVANAIQPKSQVSSMTNGLTAEESQSGVQNIGYVYIPKDGGYTFTLLTSTTASLMIDGARINSPKLQAQVCGSEGYAVQALRLSASLSRGLHHVAITRGTEIENASMPGTPLNQPILYWEGSGIDLERIPWTVLFHGSPVQ